MIGVVATLVSARISFGISWTAYQQGTFFAWHPICMIVGALFLSTAGIQAVRWRRSAGQIRSKTSFVQAHSLLSSLALVFMTTGTYVIYANKQRMGKPHLTSWHAWIGVVAYFLWAANVALAASKTIDLGQRRVRFLWLSNSHRWLGAAAYATSLIALCLGLHSGWGLSSLNGQRGAWAVTAGVAVVFVGVVYEGMIHDSTRRSSRPVQKAS